MAKDRGQDHGSPASDSPVTSPVASPRKRPPPAGLNISFSPSRERPSFSGSLDFKGANKPVDQLRKDVDENSPLIAPARRADDGYISPLFSPGSEDESEEWEEGEQQETRSTWYLILLTIAIGGLQICWSVELAYGSPYLLSLGLSKSLLAFVWIAGPLSGTLVQPYVGMRSDRSRIPWGRRRPFMIGGAIATILSLFCLAWAREIVVTMLGLFGVDREAEVVNTVAIIFAVLIIYILDFAINVIQAAVRAFIVDNAPPHQQNDANAWASRLSGVGNILGYISGYVDLPQILPWFGNTQFKVLCVIACLALGITVALSCISIKERDPRLDGEASLHKDGIIAFFTDLYYAMRRLPPQIKKVCQVQFFAWIGWFPFLFYTTTFIAEIYADPFFKANPNLSPSEINEIWGRGTRLASFSLLIFAITTFCSSVFLPLFVQPTFRAPGPPPKTPMTPGAIATPGSFAGDGYFSSRPARRNRRPRLERIMAKLPSLRIPHLTLRRLYIISHILFTLATWSTMFITTTKAATCLVAFIGVPWAVSNWAPYALIAAEISKRDAIRHHRIRPDPDDVDAQLIAEGEDPANGADQAGIVLGIHNVAIAAPQVIATLVSSVIFRFLQKPRGVPGDDSVGWVLRFGGLAAIGAAVLARRINEERS
ncbi:proteinral alpha-glucoside permease [Sphaceloma murrayae]|uniref:Proteinral alpha-glucoside permease n=1 Tax=Sphaceloma murrayae TaxID=2082308 RepID=A0A2K1QKP4_9PEZI|nr:proteinral alpha-glucoside permease [Sphaceloma murrayae]